MKTLIEKIENFITAPVVIIGDIMLDRYVEGDVSRVSPEAPIPILRQQKVAAFAGGAANVAAKVAGLEATARLIGIVGKDEAGKALLSELQRLGVDTSNVSQSGRPTTLKTRLIARNQQMLRLDREDSSPLTAHEEKQVIAGIRRAMKGAAGLIIEDYGKGLLTKSVLGTAISTAKKARIPIVVDPNGRNYSRYKGATVITPNNSEATLGANLPDEPSYREEAGKKLAKETAAVVAVTVGADGIILVYPNGDCIHVPTKPVEVFDVTGAGDAVAAVMCLALASGEDMLTTARLANVAGGVIVRQFGVGKLSRLDMIRYIGHIMGDASHKVVDRETAAKYAEDARRVGRKVVFTNGCFDLLHSGHIRSLEQSRAQGDMLIVGINSDASVKRLKGPERPVIEQEGRARVLAAMEAVDLVVIFDEVSVLSLVKAIKPDVLVKGGSYKKEEVVGWDFVESYGGRVYLVPLQPGESTSNIVARIRKKEKR